MYTKDTLFQIKLEDYAAPRYASVIKSYYGSMEEMIDMLTRLEDDPQACTRYKETLDAAEYYDLDDQATHTVAGKTLPIFTPATIVSRHEDTLEKPYWYYVTPDQRVFPCYATQIDLRQTLVETETGYDRCVQANLSDLCVCYQNTGWALPPVMKGFPGMVVRDGDTFCMSLSALQAHYEFDELDRALRETADSSHVNLALLVADIIAEG